METLANSQRIADWGAEGSTTHRHEDGLDGAQAPEKLDIDLYILGLGLMSTSTSSRPNSNTHKGVKLHVSLANFDLQ